MSRAMPNLDDNPPAETLVTGDVAVATGTSVSTYSTLKDIADQLILINSHLQRLVEATLLR